MCLLVYSKISFLCKSSSALFTSIGFISCMYSQHSKVSNTVGLQKGLDKQSVEAVWSGSSLLAILTLSFWQWTPDMCILVCSKISFLCKHSTTFFTSIRILSFMYSKGSKISNANCLTKRPRQTVQTLNRPLLRKQSNQSLPCLLFWQVILIAFLLEALFTDSLV